MKILLTGGGTGGHFYPIIAVANSLSELAEEQKIARVEMVFMSDSPYDEEALLRSNISFKKVYAGKLRRYFSLKNISDSFKTAAGLFKAIWHVYLNFPDVAFSKGGYASFPVVFACRIFGIPLLIHESDSVPGKVNQWAGKFAKKVAISFSRSAGYFPGMKIALTGNPVRREFFTPARLGAKDYLNLEEGTPTILVIGGSQGSKKINEAIFQILPDLLEKYQIIHQCGKSNYEELDKMSKVTLQKLPFQSRYHLFGFLDESAMRMSLGAADLVISRAGSGSIFEIAASGLPGILIPLLGAAQDHQRENAYSYAASGAADVVEEANLTPHLLQSEVGLLLQNKEKLEKMSESAKNFAKPDAAKKIAQAIIDLALEHAQ